ncbi:MAG: carbonic anhydrase [Tannerella sp.]|jgi:carbonic anhydrase|nr:carbonic anhydrase [Tannerella sp.]
MYFSKKMKWALLLSFAGIVAQAQVINGEVLDLLKEGNKRFCTNQMIHQHQDAETLKTLVEGQHPFAVVISCSDSRVTPEIIFDQGLGDLFSIRTAGNVMADFEEGSVEYAVDHLHTQLVVVMGHTHCGAIKAFLDTKDEHQHEHADHGHVQSILDKLDSEPEEKDVLENGDDLYNQAIRANISNGVRQLRESDPMLSKMYHEHQINIVGAIYNIESGEVEFLNI